MAHSAPGAGKSTVADALHDLLFERGLRSCKLDGDDLRQGLNADLGFQEGDRTENVRLGEVAILLARVGHLSIGERDQPLRRRPKGRPGAPRWQRGEIRRGLPRHPARGLRRATKGPLRQSTPAASWNRSRGSRPHMRSRSRPSYPQRQRRSQTSGTQGAQCLVRRRVLRPRDVLGPETRPRIGLSGYARR